MPQCDSISAVSMVAVSRSPETPEELSPSKNIRSAGQRGQADHDVGLVLGAPPGELVLRRDRGDHAEVGAALLDRGDVDVHVPPGGPGQDGVAGLVHGDGVPLALDVLDVLGGPRSLRCLARITSFQVIVSRSSRIALISASFTRSLMVAPVA